MQSEAKRAHAPVVLQVMRKYGHSLGANPVTCPLTAPAIGVEDSARFFKWQCPPVKVGSDGGIHEYAAHPANEMQAEQQDPESGV